MADSDQNAVFRRAKLTDLLADYGADACQGLTLIPFKCNLDESDLTTEEYNLDGLLNYPVLADVGCIAINADTSPEGLKAAKSAALWLYSNGEGRGHPDRDAGGYHAVEYGIGRHHTGGLCR